MLFDAKSSHSIDKLRLSPPSSLSYSNSIAKPNSRLTKNQRSTSSLSVNSLVPLSNNGMVSLFQKQLVSVQVCIYVAKVLYKVCHVIWFTMHFKIAGEIFPLNSFRWQTHTLGQIKSSVSPSLSPLNLERPPNNISNSVSTTPNIHSSSITWSSTR